MFSFALPCSGAPGNQFLHERKIIMTIPRHLIVAMLRERGKPERAEFVDRQLPADVDPERHSGLLATLGIKLDEFTPGAAS